MPELRAVGQYHSVRVRDKILKGCQFIPEHGDEYTNYIFRDFITGLYKHWHLLKEQKSLLECAIKIAQEHN
jgi:hypothetical protein